MSSETLREAARVLRERAGNATPGPWKYVNTEVLGDGTPFGDVRDPKGQRVGDSDDEGSAFIIFDGLYVATVHPGVGFALADWLDVEAYHVESHECAAQCEPDGCERVEKATTVARAILGESA